MRSLFHVGFLAVVTCGLIGCGNGNKAKAEKLMDQIISETTLLAKGFEDGDKSAVNNCIGKIIQYGTEAKAIRLTQAENDALKKRFEEKLKGLNARMNEAVKKASTSGKFSATELLELGAKLRDVSNVMK